MKKKSDSPPTAHQNEKFTDRKFPQNWTHV